MSGAAVLYREAGPDDLVFVVSSWVSSFKSAHGSGILSVDPLEASCDCGRPVKYDYASVMKKTLEKLLRRPGVSIWVAYNPRAVAPLDLHGYLVVESKANMPSYKGNVMVVGYSDEPLVHYVFVKDAYRHHGIASALFRMAGVDLAKPFLYTCRTPVVSKLEKSGKINARDAKWFPLSSRFDKKESKIP